MHLYIYKHKLSISGSWIALCSCRWSHIQCLGGRLNSTRSEISRSLCHQPIIPPNSPATGWARHRMARDSVVPVLDTQLRGAGLVQHFGKGRTCEEFGTCSDCRCAPLEVDNSTFCTVGDMSTSNSTGCHYETFIKGQQTLQATGLRAKMLWSEHGVRCQKERRNMMEDRDGYGGIEMVLRCIEYIWALSIGFLCSFGSCLLCALFT